MFEVFRNHLDVMINWPIGAHMDDYLLAAKSGVPIMDALGPLQELSDRICALDVAMRHLPWETIHPLFVNVQQDLDPAISHEVLTSVRPKYYTAHGFGDAEVLVSNLAQIDVLYPGTIHNCLLQATKVSGSLPLIRALVEQGADIYYDEYRCFLELETASEDWAREYAQYLCQVSEAEQGARYMLRGNSKYVIATRPREKESYHMVGNLIVIGDRLITEEEAYQIAPCPAKSARSVQ